MADYLSIMREVMGPEPELPTCDVLADVAQNFLATWGESKMHAYAAAHSPTEAQLAEFAARINAAADERWLARLAKSEKEKFARSLSDEMMDCVDRLGSEADTVDPRVWEHLLVYAPKQENPFMNRITNEQREAIVRSACAARDAYLAGDNAPPAARDDAKFLRQQAARLSYNASESEAVIKHRLYEIAMRIETGFYPAGKSWEGERCAKLRTVASQVLADMKAQGVLLEWQTLLEEALSDESAESPTAPPARSAQHRQEPPQP